MRYAGPVLLLLLIPGLLTAVEVRKGGTSMSQEQEYTADSLLQQADEVFQSRDYAAAREEYLKVVEKARQEFNRSVEVEALSQVARTSLMVGEKEKGREYLAQAAGRADDDDPMGWSRYLGVRGRFEWQDGDLTTARKTFDEMYVYCNTNALWGRSVDAAHMIAIVAESPEEQIEWSKRGIEAAESGGVESWLGPLWNNLAGTYFELKQYDSALGCYLKARDYHWQYSGEIAKLFADYHVGMTYRLIGDFDRAGEWLRPVLAWAERLGDHSAIGQACEDLGEIAAARGNKYEGLRLLKRARDEYRAAGFDESWPDIWDNINERISAVSQ